MSEQAIETLDKENDEAEVLETPQGEQAEEFEIVAEGEDQPASTPSVPLHKHLKRVKKLNGKVEAVNSEAEEYKRQLALKDEELKVLLARAQTGDSQSEPEPYDFETDAEYLAAKNRYDEERIAGIAERKALELFNQNQTTANQQANEQAIESRLVSHYERAESLNIANYESVEDNAIEVMGKDVCKLIMAKSPQSEKLLYNLGLERNEAKAREFARLLKEDLASGLMELGGYARSLKVQPKRSHAPDPERKLEGGEIGTDAWSGRYEKLLTKIAKNDGSATLSDLAELKREAKAAGVKLNR